MVLLDGWGCNGRQIIPQNYFDEASIELLPNALLNFAIHLRTKKESFECCGISLVWRYERNPRRRIALMCLFALVIVMVGISRIYLGVHYASDVLGGFCVSTIWLVLYTKVIAPALRLIE